MIRMNNIICFLLVNSEAVPKWLSTSNLTDTMTEEIGLNGEVFNYEDYNNLENINLWMVEMTKKYRFVKKIKLGESFENREISALKISSSESKSKNVIFFNGCMEGRDWMSPAHLILYTKTLLELYRLGDAETVETLDKIDIIFTYVSNPDGYFKTWNDPRDRYWRKNTAKYSDKCTLNDEKEDFCNWCKFGTHLNRNFDIKWGGDQYYDSHECSKTYHGPKPFSEPESRALRDFGTFLTENYDNIAFLDTYSAGNRWMYPYSYTDYLYDHDEDLFKSISKNAVESLTSVHGTKFRYGTGERLEGTAYGTATDYFYEKIGVRCSFVIELRIGYGDSWRKADTYTRYFNHPKDEIKPVAEEMAAAYQVVLKNVIDGNCSKGEVPSFDYNYDDEYDDYD